ncbi:Hint domain-containing protein [Polyangium spumosum]|uniref:Hint domain-containing protein n=1 Tax=Polyangium spumosum TaxID=889282 RepID=A0A6N7Q260_9BACT|nr:Hint domain-containing protein [Polyangium spumosum]MRG95031.1 hypothetical protein [Polyangium spumosum]
MKRAGSIFGMGLVFFGIGVAAMGCSGAPDTADPIEMMGAEEGESRVEPADGPYMRALVEKAGKQGAVKIDLADDRQFGFLKERMARNDINAETAPRVFERLQLARDKAVAIKTGKVHPSVATASAGAADRCGIYIVNERLDATAFSSMARGSCIGGATYSYVDQYLYDASWNMLDFDYKEEWNKGIAADVRLSAVPPSTKGVFAEGVVYHETTTTVEAYYYATSVLVNHMILDAPSSAMAPELPGAQAVKGPEMASAVDHQYTLDAPRDFTGDKSIMMCLDRNTYSTDCDYKHTDTGACSSLALCEGNTAKFPVNTPTYDFSKLYMPMQGSSKLIHGPNVNADNPWEIQSAKAWVTMRTAGADTPAGGLCEGSLTDLTGAPKVVLKEGIVAFQKRYQIVINPFAPALGNVAWEDHCTDNGKQIDLDVEVTLYQPNNALGETLVYNWTTRPTTQNPSAPPMSIWWGCLPTGTEISLADGKRAPIERIGVGQQVVSDDHGRTLTVVDVVEGAERRPLVRVVDDRGHVLTMTTTHAVPLANAHIVQAQEMQVGDQVIGKDGLSTIVSVERIEYEGPVYNLVLGTADELGGVSKQGTTMFANGVLVGDSRLQGAITQLRSDEAALADRVASLPVEFKEDYRLSMIREQKRAAKR